MSALDTIDWAARCAPNAKRISAEIDEERKMETEYVEYVSVPKNPDTTNMERYNAGDWSRRNLEALLEDVLAAGELVRGELVRRSETRQLDIAKPFEMLRSLRSMRDQSLAHGSRTMRDFARALDGLIDEYDDLGQQVIDEEAGC